MAVDIVDTEESKEMDEAKSFSRRFVLWPKKWESFSIDLSRFSWKEYKFIESVKRGIPEQRGVYTFVIKPQIANHPSCAYLMYVGQTTDQTLKERFRKYLDEQKGKGKHRAKVKYILNKYKDYIYFICMPLGDGISPKEIESELIKAFIPPMNDYLPAEVRRIVKVLSL